MALFSRSDLVSRARQARATRAFRAAEQILLSDAKSAPTTGTFDVFLSHSSKDADVILGLKTVLETDFGLKVYVDWVEDPQLSRADVSSSTAAALKKRMDQSRCLFYAASQAAVHSKWMPWELGYVDGKNGRVAIAPIVTGHSSDEYSGVEYLGVYPYVVRTGDSLWIHRSATKYLAFKKWLSGAPI